MLKKKKLLGCHTFCHIEEPLFKVLAVSVLGVTSTDMTHDKVSYRKSQLLFIVTYNFTFL